jgi:REP element-mobilizing transposase RayT
LSDQASRRADGFGSRDRVVNFFFHNAEKLNPAITVKNLTKIEALKKRLWGGHLWSPSYYITTAGGAPLETLKNYVEYQRDK